ncbi:uncharacterized protein LOC134467132 [Engraulis encrasicolus]|uniref:uncharacterized protein LOC134467132 n=1 Tax=Engraulis encrasicolus TaxID=184585 RepID=UPI002FCFF9BC
MSHFLGPSRTPCPRATNHNTAPVGPRGDSALTTQQPSLRGTIEAEHTINNSGPSKGTYCHQRLCNLPEPQSMATKMKETNGAYAHPPPLCSRNGIIKSKTASPSSSSAYSSSFSSPSSSSSPPSSSSRITQTAPHHHHPTVHEKENHNQEGPEKENQSQNQKNWNQMSRRLSNVSGKAPVVASCVDELPSAEHSCQPARDVRGLLLWDQQTQLHAMFSGGAQARTAAAAGSARPQSLNATKLQTGTAADAPSSSPWSTGDTETHTQQSPASEKTQTHTQQQHIPVPVKTEARTQLSGHAYWASVSDSERAESCTQIEHTRASSRASRETHTGHTHVAPPGGRKFRPGLQEYMRRQRAMRRRTMRGMALQAEEEEERRKSRLKELSRRQRDALVQRRTDRRTMVSVVSTTEKEFAACPREPSGHPWNSSGARQQHATVAAAEESTSSADEEEEDSTPVGSPVQVWAGRRTTLDVSMASTGRTTRGLVGSLPVQLQPGVLRLSQRERRMEMLMGVSAVLDARLEEVEVVLGPVVELQSAAVQNLQVLEDSDPRRGDFSNLPCENVHIPVIPDLNSKLQDPAPQPYVVHTTPGSAVNLMRSALMLHPSPKTPPCLETCITPNTSLHPGSAVVPTTLPQPRAHTAPMETLLFQPGARQTAQGPRTAPSLSTDMSIHHAQTVAEEKHAHYIYSDDEAAGPEHFRSITPSGSCSSSDSSKDVLIWTSVRQHTYSTARVNTKTDKHFSSTFWTPEKL